MNFETEILNNRQDLKEVYNLRVTCWESSYKKHIVNYSKFPKGWYDELDSNAIHFIIRNDVDEIIASARLNCFEKLDDFLFKEWLENIHINKNSPFGFYSRLVVLPEYRGIRLGVLLDKSILKYSKQKEIDFVMGFSTERTSYMVSKLGFEKVGSIKTSYSDCNQHHPANVLIKKLRS